MPQRDWNESYSSGEVPWDTGKPDALLVDTVRNGTVTPGRVLEVGCGTGTNAIWLASQGFTVLGIDVAPLAIEKARKKATAVGVDCRFEVMDLLKDHGIPGGPYDFVFDRGCFHIFDSAEERTRFAQRVEAQLKPGGQWLSLIGSTEGPERESGPPRRSARDVTNAVEPAMEILELHSAVFHADIPEAAAAWFCLSRKRHIPAVPSTRRVA
ncbi:MAG: class I SAM-dependent methyltransferase [Flavobacteriales bacterium]|jgi:SAM-dependent methyltransferase|nr:class I SAM-dependent methyltransferase [Flavobacteriales bacterium]MCB0759727.1 class I SAM-dependent methyltransferase [Flavobacteriales bacterium]